jgi:hypothetical protein
MIKVTLALAADYASVSMGGKLNILGIFDSLHSEGVPVIVPHIYLVLRLEGDSAEANKRFAADIQLIDSDGNLILSMPGILILPPPPQGKFSIKYDQVFPLFNLKFDQFGNYEFKIFINNEIRAHIPLWVLKIEPVAPRIDN